MAHLHRRRLRLNGIRLRLLLSFGAVALITAAAVSGISYYLTGQAILSRVENNSLNQFKADTVQAAAITTGSASEIRSRIANLLSAAGNDVVVIQGGATGGSFPSRPDVISEVDIPNDLKSDAAGSTVWARRHISGQPYLVMGTTLKPSGIEVFSFVSLVSEQEDLNRLAQNSALAAGGALAGAMILALLAAHNVLHPIRRLGIAARRLGQGRLDTRLEVRGSDEIADVARTFNETAEALERSIAELRSMDAASRRFVADVSHELRTPLTAMTAVTDVLEEGAEHPDADSGSAAKLIVSETRRLTRLVEDLIEISRFDAGTAALRLEETDLVQLIHASLEARLWAGKVTVDTPEEVHANVDTRRFDVIVANLVGNAMRHGEQPIVLELRATPTYLLLTVRDSGPGVPPDALQHIFDRFYKADKARGRSEGSGLGLAIAYENARMHGGDISAYNAENGGAVFTLELPILTAEPAGMEQR